MSVLRQTETLGSVHAGHVFDLPQELCSYVNGLIESAGPDSISPGDMFIPFSPGEHVLIAIPTEPVDKNVFVDAYRKVEVTVDDQRIRLADHPRFFSSDPEVPHLFRGVPTFVPVDVFPADYYGRPVEITVYSEGDAIQGPVMRRFCKTGSGVDSVANRVNPDGHVIVLDGRVNADWIVETGRSDTRGPHTCMFVSPTFGDVVDSKLTFTRRDGTTGVAQLVPWKRVGRDWVGDTKLFEERVILDMDVLLGAVDFEMEVTFEQAGSGMLSIFGLPGRIDANAMKVY